ncbi:MAG: RNA recognition motif domain-containing protein [Acidimicrobiales bacterium]
MRLLVRNLDRSTTEATLKDLFETFGRVQSCTIVLDAATGRSKGFGFVDMPKVGDAKAAVRNLNGAQVDGERIRVKNAQGKPAKSNSDGDAAGPSQG